MVELPALAWLAIMVVSGLTAVGALHSLAAAVRNEVYLHDLHVEVVARRNAYLSDLSAEAGRGAPDAAGKVEQARESVLKAERAIAELAEAA